MCKYLPDCLLLAKGKCSFTKKITFKITNSEAEYEVNSIIYEVFILKCLTRNHSDRVSGGAALRRFV